MLFKTPRTLENLTEYTKEPDGTWRAELRVPLLRVTGLTPNDCRYRILDEFDALMAAWLMKAQKAPCTRLTESAENATPGED